MIALKKDLLQIYVYNTRAEMGRAAADACEKAIDAVLTEKDAVNMVFAAAPSQNEFLAALVRKRIDFSKINAFHMDEYAELGEHKSKSFAQYLKTHLFSKAAFKSVNLIDCKAGAEAACKKYSELLAQFPPDIVCMGIGENGHIAFNDPPVADFSDRKTVKIVELEQACRRQQVNDKCFERLDDVPRFAVTLTIPALIAARYIICTVPGERKALAVERTLYGNITTDCPASVLRTHFNCKLFLDAAGAELICGENLYAGVKT